MLFVPCCKYVRHLLVLSLSLVFLFYVYHAVSRLRRRQLGVSVGRKPRSDFAFPSVMLCASATSEDSVSGKDLFITYTLAKIKEDNSR